MTHTAFCKAFFSATLVAGLATMSAGPAAAFETRVIDLPEGTYVQNVAPAPDGKLWLTAQRQGALGVLDPATGQLRLIALGPKATPVTMVVGKDGNAYIGDTGQNAIVRVNAKTEEVNVFPVLMDDGKPTNVNSIAIDRDGIIWFTARGPVDGYGRLDPTTGAMKVWKAKEGRAFQGIAVAPGNDVWYVSVNGSYIAHIDRATGEAKVVPTPQPNVEPHGIWSDSKGNLWVDVTNAGTLNRYVPGTGKWTSWRLPGAKPPHGFGVFVDDKDIVWIAQKSGNTVYAFDPKTEKFITEITGSKPEANVRRISGRPGEIWLPEAGVARLMIVKTSGMKAAAHAVNTDVSTQKVVATAGDWTVRLTPDGMTGKKACTGFQHDDYQVQLTGDGLYISQAKNGGIKSYSVRFDDESAGAERPASAHEAEAQMVELGGDDLAKALTAKRVRLNLVTAGGRTAADDVNVADIKAAHDAIVGGKGCR